MNPRVVVVCSLAATAALFPVLGAWILALVILGLLVAELAIAVIRSFHE